jgi:hypothetical protein
MAAGTASPNYHGQLTANTVDTVTTDRAWEDIQIVSDGTARIDVTVDGTAPVVGGTPTGLVIPAAVAVLTPPIPDSGTPTVVKLISAGTPHYSIIGGL